MTALEPYAPPTAPSGSSVAIRDPRETDSWVEVMGPVGDLAERIANTEFVPASFRGKPDMIAAAMLAGRELGLPPMTSLAHISVIKGKPTISAEMARALVARQGHQIRFLEHTAARCVVEGRRRGTTEWTRVVWTIDDARRAGLAGKDLWRQYPEPMLAARASAALCRLIFPDCLAGMPATEEFTDDAEAGVAGASAGPVEAPLRTAQRRTRKPRDATPAKPAIAAVTADLPPLPEEDGDGTTVEPMSRDQQNRIATLFRDRNVPTPQRLDIVRLLMENPNLAGAGELDAMGADTLIARLAATPDDPQQFDDHLGTLRTQVDDNTAVDAATEEDE